MTSPADDDLGRKTGESVDYGDFVLSYQYDYHPNGQKKSFTGPDGITYTYNYDSAGRLLGVQIPNVGAVTVNQYEWLAPRRITLPGGTSREYTYTGLFSPQSITVRDPAGNVLADLRYSYDHLLRVAEKTLDSATYAYSYDDLQQLTAVADEASSSFEYDQAGNRQLAGEAWIYNDNDELVSRGETGYEYDANGNLIEKRSASAVIRYVYDTADRLIRVEDGTGAVLARYGYDPYDRRLWKEVGGKRTYFLYADEGLVGEYDSVGAQQRAYGFLPDTDWSTDPIFLRASGQCRVERRDQLPARGGGDHGRAGL